MKKFLIGLILSVIVVWPLFKNGFYQSHDGELHLARIAAYSQALTQGQFPVRWAAKLNYDYGYPIFNFVYPLPYLLASSFNLLGLSVIVSLKLILGLSLVLSGILMYLAVKTKLKNDWSGLAAAGVYVLAPYRILNVYVRAALGEAVAFVLVPLVLLLFWKKKWVFVCLSMAALILSHNALGLIFLPFLGLAMIKELKSWAISLGLALGLSAWFWLPSLMELKYTLAKVYLAQKDFHNYFVSLKNLIYMPWSFSGEQIPTYIGWLGIGILAVFVYQLMKGKINRWFGWFIVLSWLGSLFFCTSYSVWLWEKLPLISFFQLPWRWLSLTVLMTALAAGWLVMSVKSKPWLSGLIVVISLIMVLPIIKVKPSDQINQIDFLTYPKTTTWHNEGSPVWTAGEADHYPAAAYEVIGQAEVSNWRKKELKHEFNILNNEAVRFIDNTVYFPGWRVLIDSKASEIQFQDPSYRGLITFNIPQGNHKIEVIFGRTKVRLIAELISIASLAALLLIYKRGRGITV